MIMIGELDGRFCRLALYTYVKKENVHLENDRMPAPKDDVVSKNGQITTA